jgi:hypothetical protein
VNQNKTFRQEIAGGFMWSPKQNSDGSRNPFYDFMTEVSTEDVIFSYAQSELIAVGIAVSSAYSSTKPRDFGSAGEIWSDEGWKVDVDFVNAKQRVNPRNHMSLIIPLLPEKYSPLQSTGFGHQRYLTSISSELGSLLLNLMGSPELVMPVSSIEDLDFDEAEQLVIQDESLKLTEKRSLVLARRGQGQFRQRVIIFEKECRVTGVVATDLLIASHIKPWKAASNDERLNGHNGLLLSPHVDKLFDSGLVSFENSGQLLVSPFLDTEVLDKWSIQRGLRVQRFGSDQSYFLEYHRSHVFQAA